MSDANEAGSAAERSSIYDSDPDYYDSDAEDTDEQVQHRWSASELKISERRLWNTFIESPFIDMHPAYRLAVTCNVCQVMLRSIEYRQKHDETYHGTADSYPSRRCYVNTCQHYLIKW